MHALHATYKVKAARAAEDDLQAAVKALQMPQAPPRAETGRVKGQHFGACSCPPSPEESGDQIGKRKSSTTQAPSNTSTSASDVTVAEETMPDTFLIILPDTNDS
ncbi:hypothetical protein B0H13DRAFT_1889232 [Mycena leptocephala]|nr:hypothetical protein B0H13DRAFT_1889232 [Mycena leptocephala]